MTRPIFLLPMLALVMSTSTRCQTDVPVPTWENSIGMSFVLIRDGVFEMGSEEDHSSVRGTFILSNQRPVHRVHISQPFYLGRFEVTQREWERVMGSNPSSMRGPERPVENVSFSDVQQFIEQLNAREGTSRYRLPTEAEWEYAARAGTDERFAGTDAIDSLCLYANVFDITAKRADPDHVVCPFCDDGFAETAPVGSLGPNRWGLYDMTGNVWEWTSDWYASRYYAVSPESDPPGPISGTHHVKRGGSWYDNDRFCRVAFRIGDTPNYRKGPVLGFRLAADIVD